MDVVEHPETGPVTLLLLKVLLAPALVVATSLAGRRRGPADRRVAGHPADRRRTILVILAVEQGAVFAGQAAAASLLGIVALGAFGLTFAAAARRFPWPVTLALSWLAVLTADLALFRVRLPAAIGLVLAVAAVQGVAALIRRRITDRVPPVEHWPWWDLPARAVATAALVLAVTGAADVLGPARAGILTPFPVAVSVICAFVLAQEGPTAAIILLEGVLRGLTGFAVFCFGVAALLPRLPPVAAFGLATAASVAVPLQSAPSADGADPVQQVLQYLVDRVGVLDHAQVTAVLQTQRHGVREQRGDPVGVRDRSEQVVLAADHDDRQPAEPGQRLVLVRSSNAR